MGVQSSLGVSATGKAAGAQEWAVGGSQVRAQQRAQGEREGERLRAQPEAFPPRDVPVSSRLPVSGLRSRGITVKVHRMRQGLEEIPWEGQAACSAPSFLPTTLSAPLLSHGLPTLAHPTPPASPPLLFAGSTADAELSAAANPG